MQICYVTAHTLSVLGNTTDTHSEYGIFLFFHSNNAQANSPKCYFIRTLPVLFHLPFIYYFLVCLYLDFLLWLKQCIACQRTSYGDYGHHCSQIFYSSTVSFPSKQLCVFHVISTDRNEWKITNFSWHPLHNFRTS